MDGSGYFLYHSIGIYPGKAADLAAQGARFALAWGAPDDRQWAAILPERARFLDRWRAILKAPPGSVTSCESVTQGFHALLAALPPAHLAGRRVVVGADCFPSNHFLLQGLAAAHGFTLVTVPLRQGAAHVEDEDLAAAITPGTGLVLMTWVSSTTSHRCDLGALVARARAVGALAVVDLTQGAGLLPFDVMAPEVDAAISTSLKWMCGTPGAGVLYVSPRLIPHCRPATQGWFSQPDPFNWDITRFALAPDIRRFDSGTPGVMAALMSRPALDWHAGRDHAADLAHTRRLTARLIAAADVLGLALRTPREEARRGGSVMLALPPSHPAGAVVARLAAAGLATDARGQTLRLSPGVMTTDAGVERLTGELAAILRR